MNLKTVVCYLIEIILSGCSRKRNLVYFSDLNSKIKNYSKTLNNELMDLQQMEVGHRVKIKQGLMNDKDGKVVRLGENGVVVVIDHLNCVLLSK